MFQKKVMVFSLIMFLLAGNIFWALDFILLKQQLRALQSASLIHESKSLLFLQAFIQKVLRSKEEVSFETRLQLENDVRELNSQQILAQWQKFVNSQTEDEAQANVKELLDLLSTQAVMEQHGTVVINK